MGAGLPLAADGWIGEYFYKGLMACEVDICNLLSDFYRVFMCAF